MTLQYLGALNHRRIFVVFWGVSMFVLCTSPVESMENLKQEEKKLLNKDLVSPSFVGHVKVGYAALHGMDLTKVEVETSDGWILEVHRIRSRNIYNEKLSTPVYLSHGFGSSSIEFMANLRNESIAFILADAGYDVWAVNYRSNRFSNRMRKKGKIVAPDKNDYYRATWQYMAERDIPAVLDMLLNETKMDKIYMIGHSRGGTVFFAFLSQNHKYDDKILYHVSIAPVIKFGSDTSEKVKALVRIVSMLPKIIIWPFFSEVFGRVLLISTSSSVNAFGEFMKSRLCQMFVEVCELLTNIMFQTSLADALKMNPHLRKERMGLYTLMYPSGITLMDTYLFARQYQRNPWTKMNYDEVWRTGITNMDEYKQGTPPVYNFSATRVPPLMYYVRNDIFMGVATDVQVLNELKIPPESYKIVDGNRLTHHDALWGWDARCYIYDSILDHLNTRERKRGNSALTTYREHTVPAFIKRLPFADGCLGRARNST